ncbi:uncharacterized protein PSFLO_04476 [Pseudozyma flocculosa]|nr:uncharacterized protein PSFLO_04476 [Pseudozyma flocculosa]
MLLKGITANIRVPDGNGGRDTLEEFQTSAKGRAARSTYVCSIDDTAFELFLRRDKEISDDLVVELTIDGVEVDGVWHWEEGTGLDFPLDCVPCGRDEERLLRFAKIARIKNEDEPDDEDETELGCIEVAVHRVKILGTKRRAWFGAATDPCNVSDHAATDRKNRGGIPPSHKIALGERRKTKRLPDLEQVYEYRDAKALAIFTYYYASRDVLEASGIVPSAPAPSGSRSEPTAADDATRSIAAANADVKVEVHDDPELTSPDSAASVNVKLEAHDDTPDDGRRRSKRLRTSANRP